MEFHLNKYKREILTNDSGSRLVQGNFYTFSLKKLNYFLPLSFDWNRLFHVAPEFTFIPASFLIVVIGLERPLSREWW